MIYPNAKMLIFVCMLMGILSFDFISENYPEPPISSKTLFYIQRSNNSNTVMYEVNFLGNNSEAVNKSRPVDVYWLRYAEEGQRKELNYLERTFGYGVNCEMVSAGLYKLNFVASKTKVAEVQITGAGKGEAIMMINEKKSKLKRIWIQVREDGWWPKIAYVEFFGVDAVTQAQSYEKMIIND